MSLKLPIVTIVTLANSVTRSNVLFKTSVPSRVIADDNDIQSYFWVFVVGGKQNSICTSVIFCLYMWIVNCKECWCSSVCKSCPCNILTKRKHSAVSTPFQSKETKSKYESYVTPAFFIAAPFQLQKYTSLICLALWKLYKL